VNRFIGIEWVANMLYPDRYAVDMVEQTQEFYRRMYRVDISTDEALEILGNSYPPYGTKAKYTPSGESHAADTDTGLSADDMSRRLAGED
jgi:iron complex transport system substrate-binding protein